MKFIDVLKALGVAVATFVITIAASFPMVAFYAYVIEPGHPQEFYNQAAQWIAPWSSHILGPLVLFLFQFGMARRAPQRNAYLFAAVTLILYAVVDLGTLPMMGLPLTAAMTPTVGVSFLGKVCGALLGAHLGGTKAAPAAGPAQGTA